ncbi:MAG: hypothetical protein AcusKO_33230 [Acuticoccus sp.]
MVHQRMVRDGGALDLGGEPVGQHARHVAGDAAAGDVSQRLDGRALGLQRRQHGAHIDARRLEERAADRARAKGGAIVEPAVGGELAHQREAVGVDAGARQRQEHVAGRERRSRQQVVALHGTDDEAGKVVVAGGVVAGHLGCFAADQRAARLAAAGGDPLDHRGGGGDIERAGGVVVEEEKRLGALGENVVDAHRHEVDADAAVVGQLAGDAQLGADTVGGGDQERAGMPGGAEVECGAEAAEAGDRAGPPGGGGKRLDAFNQRVAGRHIHAGRGVCAQRVVGHGTSLFAG